ncbi:uncharacterized protein LOC117650851 [Thrips palmi]|uniref:Uncharacterized protein LOC117650851 n=1 Tax=Thrips palmi TaxID=161013 RepID=A0A6P9A088_THRPL|nr:uncharacterized protein LOC117650851 [Thrips palmi]
MLAVRAILILALVAAASAMPADTAADLTVAADESGVSQWNEPAIAIGMFSGGRRRRSGDDVAEGSSGPAPLRERRQEDLYEDFSADAYDDADAKRVMRRQAPRRGIESPFGPTSDIEDRVRREAQDESQEDNGPVDNDHFPTEDEGKRTRRASEDTYFDDNEDGDDDDVAVDLSAFAPRKKRQVVGQDVATDDDEDVYRDLDDQPLPVWARGARDGRQRRQLDQTMTSMDDDQPDYIREPRDSETATAASPTEGSDAATEVPERDQAVESVTASVPQEGDEKLTTTSSAAPTPGSSSESTTSVQPLRERRAPKPQRGRFDGFVLSDFSGFRGGRSVRVRRSEPSEAAVIKSLLEAPIDESILGELPVRRPRQLTEMLPQPAGGGPVTFLVPLAAPQPPSAQGEDAVNANDAVPEKVLQIYTAHEPSPVAEMIPTTTTTTPAPSPAEALVPVLVPESAVSGILVPSNADVHVDVIAPDAAPAAAQPVAVQPALLQPAVVVQPAAVQQPDAAMPARDSPQQGQPLLVLQPGPVLVDPVTQVSPAEPQAPQRQQMSAPFQIPLQVPQDVSSMKQEAPQEVPLEVPQDAVPAPLVVSQKAHAVAVTEGPDAANAAATAAQPDWPMSMSVPQEVAQPMPLEWFPQAPKYPAPFEAQDQAPPRQHFDVDVRPTGGSRWTATVPILEKTIQLHPDGSYVYSYETADGVRVAEAGVLKEVPVRTEEGSAKSAGAAPATVLANSVQGGYSYTAPDGTYVSLRYLADENGFQPVLGESLPTTSSNKARAAVRFDENK